MTTHTFLSSDVLSELVATRQWLHQHPETGAKVRLTASTLASQLSKDGLEITRNVGGHGVVATLCNGNSNRAIGLRADMDALPIEEAGHPDYRSTVQQKFHGCGHDGHSVMLLGAAHVLSQQRNFDGTIHFIFQPDEETGGGAISMLEDRLLERFPMDAIYGLHNLPGMPVGHFATRPGNMTAYEEIFTISIVGRGGHSSAPHNVIDPLVAGAQTLLALQTIVSRNVSPDDYAVVSVTEIISDGARNVIPSKVTIKGDVRGYSDHVSSVIQKRMSEIVMGTATALGTTATLRYDREFPSVVNTLNETNSAAQAVARMANAHIDTRSSRFPFSEDFAHYLEHLPGCFVVMGNGIDGAHAKPLHSPYYDFNDAAIPTGIEYWVRLVEHELA